MNFLDKGFINYFHLDEEEEKVNVKHQHGAAALDNNKTNKNQTKITSRAHWPL